MRYQSPAIVIACSPFSESSQVARLLTERQGFVTVLARGTHRDKSAFGGPLDIATAGVADVSTRRGGELEMLHSFAIERPWRGLRASLQAWLAAAHVIELVRPFAWPKERAQDIHALAVATLDTLDDRKTSRGRDAIEACLAYFAAHLLRIAGFEPQLDVCTGCGAPREDTEPAGVALRVSPRLGGLLCSRCGSKDPRALRIGASGADLLKRLLGTAERPAGPPAESVTKVVREARSLLDRFAEERLERRLIASHWVADGVPSFRKRS